MSAPFRHELRVRYHECDAQGVVFNANHFAYFDIAMTELWREAFGSYQAMLETGADMMVVDAQATFRAPPRFDEVIELVVAIEGLGNTSMTTRIEERRDGELLVTGRLVHVFVDAATQIKQPIPAEVRERLAQYVTA